MGDMQVAVPDENNEINLHDFTANLTGHLSDKLSHHIDGLASSHRWTDLTTVELGDQTYDALPVRFFFNLIPQPGQAFGGGVGYMEGTSDRLVTSNLRRVFILPLEDDIGAPTEDVIFESKLRMPAFSAHYTRRFGDRIAGGLQWRYNYQRERKTTPNVYMIEHKANTHRVKASLAYDVVQPRGDGGLRSLVIGANGEIGETWITGTSEDDLHRDEYEWNRPGWTGTVHAFSELAGDVKVGLDFRYSSFEGQETASYNWSPQFAYNPTGFTMIYERSVFEEGRRFRELALRVEEAPRSAPYYLGFAFRALQDQYWQTPHLNVNSYVRAKNLQETTWQALGGGSYFLPRGRGTVAGEISYGFTDLDDRISAPTRRVPTSTLELGGGAEYFVTMRVGLRGGYRRIHFDGYRGLDDSSYDRNTNRYTVGAAFRTPDGRWQVDAGYRYDQTDRQDPDPQVEDVARSEFRLQVRWMI
jgi:opacity protein-like surface antigen